MKEKIISVFGLGYVGLATAVCFAHRGVKVIGVDVDPNKVKLIGSGKSPFYELQMEEFLHEALRKGFFLCTNDYLQAVQDSDISFITVGTPSRPDGSIDLQFIEAVSKSIGEGLRWKRKYHLVVVKSTVVPGTVEKIVKPLIEESSGKQCGVDFGLCANPEFLREGSAIQDTFNPDRIVIGEFDRKSGDFLENLFRKFYGGKMPPVIRTTLSNAELIKYANNAFLAMKISFINEVANICERVLGSDVNVVAEAIGLDKRVGRLFLNAGLGYGGSCLPKDLKALISFSRKIGYDPVLISAVEKINEAQPYKAVELARKLIGELAGKRIAVLGLAFKPNTDDMRNAVSIKIISKLLEERAEVVAYDPVAMPNARKIFGDRIRFASSALNCIKDADCCIIVTEWDEFRCLKPEDFVKYMKNPCLVD